ncbi:hypothetical protein CR513_23046, partial [Mucuna pruriens]
MHECLMCRKSWYKVKNDYSSCDVSSNGPLVKLLDGIQIKGNVMDKLTTRLILCNYKYIMLSTMISGSRQLGNDINVCLRPLIEMLWEGDADMFDGYCHEYFVMHVILFCTLNDFSSSYILGVSNTISSTCFLR